MESPKILLVDDHSIVRTGVKALLKQQYPNVSIEEAWDEASVIEVLVGFNPDLIVSDLTFSHAHDGSYFINKMLPLYGAYPVLILSMQSPEFFAARYLNMGIRGYVHKDESDIRILEGIQHVLEKGYYRKNLPVEVEVGGVVENPLDKLSKREMEVLRLVVKGDSLKSISSKLNIQVSTASTFKIRMMEKLGVETTLDLARLYDQFDHH